MRAGRLRHRVTIQTSKRTQDRYGSVIHEWIDGPEIWASVEPIRGREYFAAQQVQSETTFRVRCRYHPELVGPNANTRRLIFEGRIFEIEAVLDTAMRHRQLEIMCHDKG